MNRNLNSGWRRIFLHFRKQEKIVKIKASREARTARLSYNWQQVTASSAGKRNCNEANRTRNETKTQINHRSSHRLVLWLR